MPQKILKRILLKEIRDFQDNFPLLLTGSKKIGAFGG